MFLNQKRKDRRSRRRGGSIGIDRGFLGHRPARCPRDHGGCVADARLGPRPLDFREKELFTPPLLTLATRSEPYIRSRLSPERLGTRGFFDEGYVQASLDAFFEGPTKSLAYRLWTPVAFQVWYELQAG